MKIAGLYACCDLRLLHWLTYLPSPKLATDPVSGVDRSEVMVDVGIAQATLPITSPTSQGSVCYTAILLTWTIPASERFKDMRKCNPPPIRCHCNAILHICQ